jgi:subtilase family serine protease
LDALLAAQQQPNSPEYHKWLTPQEFGERFGASESDISQLTLWLQSQGFHVVSVHNNASTISFTATAGGVRNTFHAQLHYWNVMGGKHMATTTEPEIPAALANVVSGISGLNKLPAHGHHTAIQREAYDATTGKWHTVDAAAAAALVASAQPHYTDGMGGYNMTPQDFYTIYNVNPIYAAGNLGAGGTVAIVGEEDMQYGTVTNGVASGGDVNTFRKLFGVKGTLHMLVQHGDANVPCSDPGGDSGETALDAEWSNALAPNATLIVETCSTDTGGFLATIMALVDANVADVISSSLGSSESLNSSSDISGFNTAFAQAAAQGQTVLSAQGDSGSDDADFNVGTGPGVSGLTVDFPGSSPLVLSIGGTDFQDKYDVDRGSSTPQSTYWSATNSQYYGDALGYVPETVWDASCANTVVAIDPFFGGGLSPASYCATGQNADLAGAGGGGISTIYAQPTYQAGVPGLSASVTKRAVPDISGFSANGLFGHLTIMCDSGSPSTACTSPSTFGGAGGTSFAAPELAGVFTLLKTGTGSRQGLVQPALYALAKAQYSAGTACYANGQTSNTGITTGLPASTCVFHDVTTGDNDEACQAGTTDCFANSGASIGVLSTTLPSLTYGYLAGVHYDIATGLGSVNVANLINNFNKAFSSSTALTATPTSITAAQSTTLKATVTTGRPSGSTGSAPPLTGTVNFKAGTKALGSCMLSGGTCSIAVSGSALALGPNSVTATFSGSGTYPSSVSGMVTVTVTSSTTTVPAKVSATAFVYNRSTKTFNSTYTITNTTSGSFAGPIELVLTNLNSGVTVGNAAGMYNGSPYLTVSTTALASGASASVTVQFSDPTNATIAPTPVVYSGAL